MSVIESIIYMQVDAQRMSSALAISMRDKAEAARTYIQHPFSLSTFHLGQTLLPNLCLLFLNVHFLTVGLVGKVNFLGCAVRSEARKIEFALFTESVGPSLA